MTKCENCLYSETVRRMNIKFRVKINGTRTPGWSFVDNTFTRSRAFKDSTFIRLDDFIFDMIDRDENTYFSTKN